MTDRLALVGIAVAAFVLAVLELFFLPVRLDGTLLPRVDDLPFPITVVLAIVTTPMLVVAASWHGRRTLSVVSPLLVWTGTLLLFGLFGPGGDVVLLNDWRTLVLFAGGALPGAIAVGAHMGRTAGAGDDH
ncbi:hypothetical protein IOD16_01200 [Saccharothrix sp. 6-C]|uniref:Uncharacterized protein n=1 Tax=Saccharothrix texasensis TaxID=103734 RepID=A0A3N1H864_9PSEU|nr:MULTISPECIES: hypothetical protein [Saccharothrix]QQQ77203.1 hypothetical protein IOD16_01200 [Saccharothrix sp. 6-C]ROP38432.1 hypothetical protein EDD40_3786 [Saccharothrix texasensis]